MKVNIRKPYTPNSNLAKAVVVLGSPRSGTSLTTKVVHDFGFYADYGRADRFNEEGYWENPQVGRINGMIMEYNGFDGFACETLPAGWENSKGLRHLDSEADRIIQSMNARGDWVVKNPQFSMTLPYWKRFLPRDTRYLICVRNPVDVAKSMKRQRNIDPNLGLEIWFNCTISALKNTEGKKCKVVLYEDYFSGDRQIREIGEFLDAKNVGTNSAVSPGLRHFVNSSTENYMIPEKIRKLFESLTAGEEKRVSRMEPLYHHPKSRVNLYYRARARIALRIGLERAAKLKQRVTSKPLEAEIAG